MLPDSLSVIVEFNFAERSSHDSVADAPLLAFGQPQWSFTLAMTVHILKHSVAFDS